MQINEILEEEKLGFMGYDATNIEIFIKIYLIFVKFEIFGN